MPQAELIGIAVPLLIPAPTSQAHYQDGNQYIFLENYTDSILPNPFYIRKILMTIESPLAPLTASGNFSMAVDCQMTYAKRSGFPPQQHVVISDDIKSLGFMKIEPGGPVHEWVTFDLPVAYRPGDGIMIAPGCTSPDGNPLNFYIEIMGEGTQDFISSATPYALNVTQDLPSPGNAACCIRNVVPGPTAAATQVRFHLSFPYNMPGTAGLLCKAAKVSVGLQSGNSGPNMTAAPVRMARNGVVGPITFGQAWTDWTPFNIPAGQNVLAEICLSEPGSGNNWAIAQTGGAGDFYSTVDSSGSAAMLGTPVWQPGRTMIIDRVQYR